jgi:hypothetical protein
MATAEIHISNFEYLLPRLHGQYPEKAYIHYHEQLVLAVESYHHFWDLHTFFFVHVVAISGD